MGDESKMNIPEFDSLNCNTCSRRTMSVHYPEFCKMIDDSYPATLSWTGKLYWYYNHLSSPPACPVCGNHVHFINLWRGYRMYCSRECMNRDPAKKAAVRETNVKKYGGPAPAASLTVREKMRNTSIDKYGSDYTSVFSRKSQETTMEKYGGLGNASPLLREKFNATCLERYGTVSPMSNPEVARRQRETVMRRYGVDHVSKIPGVAASIGKRHRMHTISLEKYADDVIGVDFKSGQWIVKCPHPECDLCSQKTYLVHNKMYNDRKTDHTEPCTRLFPPQEIANKNTSIELFIRRLLDENGISYETNVRSIIPPREVDIYIPDKRIAIECNGCYWHSSHHKDRHYHYKKWKECEEKGIQLLSIWQDWIISKPEIVKSIILSKLGLYQERIYARKCDVREVRSRECTDFLNDNHLQGAAGSRVRIGLYHNNELVGVMTFGQKRRFMREGSEWEMVRYCSKKGVQVIGGSERMLKNFIKEFVKENHPSTITSFSSNDISDGRLYERLGFKRDDKISESYWYVDPGTYKRYHRFAFRKSELVKEGEDPSKTEEEIMDERGFYRIYDSGQSKWMLNI